MSMRRLPPACLIPCALLGIVAHRTPAAEAPPSTGEEIAEAEAPRAPMELTAERAATIARHHADRVQAARAGDAAARAEGRARVGPLLPQVSLHAGYTRFEGVSEPDSLAPDVDFDESYDHYGASARVEQLVWSFGRIQAALDARRALGTQGAAELRLAERDAAWRARRAVAGVQHAKALRWVAEERVAQRESELADAEDRHAVGAVSMLDVRESRLQLIEARNALIAAGLAVTQAHHELSAALALEDRELLVPGDLARPLDLGPLIEAARGNIAGGPEIAALRARSELSSAERAERRGEALPEVQVFGEWRTDGNELDDQEDQWQVGLSLSWSAFDGGSDWARSEAAARERVRLIRLSDEAARERLRQYDDLAAGIESLGPRIAAAEEAVELAEANYEDARDRYRQGVIDRVRLGQSNLEITEARLRLVNLVFREATAAYDLMRLAE